MSTLESPATEPGALASGLHVRWLGRVPYGEALDLQRGLYRGRSNHLLLLEHEHVFTLGARADLSHLLVDPEEVGATLATADRGGDITYHGPGQLTGYPILTVPGKRGGGMADTVRFVRGVEQLVIDTVQQLGLHDVGRLDRYPGVWVAPDSNPRKLAAVGIRLSRGRSMHGFALNVDPDLEWFDRIVPCGIDEHGVTSLAAEGISVSMQDVVATLSELALQRWGSGQADTRQEVVWRHVPGDLSAFSRGLGPGEVAESPASAPAGVVEGLQIGPTRRSDGTTARRMVRLANAGVGSGLEVRERKPSWLKAKLVLDDEVRRITRTMRSLDLVTVCEEAGCPNLSECWSQGTATFMINGERCTRACGFCLVDTRKPEALDPGEPERIAEAVEAMGLQHAVVTAVARDDLPDGGAGAFAATIDRIRARSNAAVEVLIPDFGGDPEQLGVVLDARPDVLNHNLETVARLQRAARPNAGYARSLTVLARAKAAGLVAKSGLIVGLGEDDDEVDAALCDLAAVGCDIVTIGQYLRPTSNHLPVNRWVTPEQFERWAVRGRELGIGHVESSPLTRSSYHAAESSRSLAHHGG